MLNINLISNSLILILALLIGYFSIGSLFREIVKKIIQKDVHFTIFKTVLYGVLIVVFFYALIKSPYLLNSVSITFVPVLLFYYEKSKLLNIKCQAVNYRNLTKWFLLGSLAFFIFYIAKYLFHFSHQINTGYSDQAFYHAIASSLKYTGIETINIHTGALNLIPGMIYHYWDLWFLAFHYDFLSTLNHFGLFESFNQFEINILVFQPSLFLILLIGFIETSFKISEKILIKIKFRAFVVTSSALLVLCQSFLEFGIIHHPKQFLIASFFIILILEMLEHKTRFINVFYFYPILLFCYPLPGSVLIATSFLISIKRKKNISNFRENYFRYQLTSIIFTFILFIWYYFFYAQTCIPKLYTQNKLAWNVPVVLNRIFIYHGYHTIVSPLGLFVLLNSIIGILIYKKRILTNNISANIFNVILIFSILNIFVGHFSSAMLYNLPEEFQFYNNDYFSLSILMLCDVYLLFNYLKSKLMLILSISIFSIIYFMIKTFHQKPSFYKGISLYYKEYNQIKGTKNKHKAKPQVQDDLPVLYSTSDIICSFFNSYPIHRKNLCSGK